MKREKRVPSSFFIAQFNTLWRKMEKVIFNLREIKKILFVRLRLIGDVLMTTPSLKVLKDSFPEAKIYYLVEPPQDELLRGNPDIDELMVIRRDSSFKELLSLVIRMRKEKFDVAIDFHGGPRASFLTLLSGAKFRIGYNYSPRKIFYNLKVERGVKEGYIHSVLNQFNLLKVLGIESNDLPPLLMQELEGFEKEKLEQILKERGLEEKKFLVMHVSAGNKYREWGVENWKRLIEIIANKRKDLKVALIGSKKDLSYEENLGFPIVVSFIGKLNLREVRELIKKSLLFVGPDSGPMHIASTTETPIIALFGPTSPSVFGPWKKEAVIIEGFTNCRPCNQKKCDYNFRCIREIKSETVFEEIERILK